MLDQGEASSDISYVKTYIKPTRAVRHGRRTTDDSRRDSGGAVHRSQTQLREKPRPNARIGRLHRAGKKIRRDASRRILCPRAADESRRGTADTEMDAAPLGAVLFSDESALGGFHASGGR